MKIIAIVQTMDKVTAYASDGASFTFPTESPQAKCIIDGIEELSEKGSVELNFDLKPENSSLCWEDIMKFFSKDTGINFLTVLKNVITAPIFDAKIIENIASAVGKPLKSEETVVAKVGDRCIAGVEKLSELFKHAQEFELSSNIARLFERLIAMDPRNQHTVEDILAFLEKADLPIDNDGNIIAYKTFNYAPDGVFVDCYSNTIRQNVGCIVEMDRDLVEGDRNQECSVGLHICRRKYLNGWGGQVCTLVRVKPEDIVAVPKHDPNKVRVCRYEILTTIPDDNWDLLKQGDPISLTEEGEELVSRAVAGDFPEAHTLVHIVDPVNQDYSITSLDPRIKKPVLTKQVRSVGDHKKRMTDTIADKKHSLKKTQAIVSPNKVLADYLTKKKYSKKDVEIIMTIKRKYKKSFKSLGFNEQQIKEIVKYVES